MNCSGCGFVLSAIHETTCAENSTTWIFSTDFTSIFLFLFYSRIFFASFGYYVVSTMIGVHLQLLEQLKYERKQKKNGCSSGDLGEKERNKLQRIYSLCPINIFEIFIQTPSGISVRSNFIRIGNKNRIKSWRRRKFTDSLQRNCACLCDARIITTHSLERTHTHTSN